MELNVLNRQRSRQISVEGVAAFLLRAARELASEEAGEWTLCFVSERRMTDYNRRYRGGSGPTDVLAFGSDGTPDLDGRLHLGDVVISVPTAARQARERGHSLARELRVLALHGYLHLLGYDHETDEGEMRRLERRLERRLLAPRRPRRRRAD